MKLTTCCNAEIEAIRFGDDALDHCSDCLRCVEGLNDTYENEHSHITSAPEFRDPLANHRQWQESDPLYRTGFREGEKEAYTTTVAQFRHVLEVAGEAEAIQFIFSLERTYECGLCGYTARADQDTLKRNHWTFGNHKPICDRHDTQRMLRAIDRDSETSGHRDFRRAA